MRPIVRGLAALTTAIALAACGGSGTPTTGPGATSAAAPCADSTGATVVSATVSNNTWSQPVAAKVGDVITWTNSDGVPHKVALDDNSCAMSKNITTEAPQSLAFTTAGTFAFHCAIHSGMKGTITIS